MIKRKLARETSCTVYYTNRNECHMKHGTLEFLEEYPTKLRPRRLGRRFIDLHAEVAANNGEGRIPVRGRKRI